MNSPKAKDVKKYVTSLKKLNKKYVTSEILSSYIGVYPQIINDDLFYFEPTLKMDFTFNLMSLIPLMETFLSDIEKNKVKTIRKKSITKKIIDEYSSIGDFIYKKMTLAGGLINKNAVLNDTDLRILKKLINIENKKRKNNK